MRLRRRASAAPSTLAGHSTRRFRVQRWSWSPPRWLAHTRLLQHPLPNVLLPQAGSPRVDGHEPRAAAGGSLRDMARVAGANRRIWVDIFLDNAEALAAALAEHRRRIEQVEQAL